MMIMWDLRSSGILRSVRLAIIYRRFGTAWSLKTEPIGCSETSVDKYNGQCVTSQKSEDLIYTTAEAWNLAWWTSVW